MNNTQVRAASIARLVTWIASPTTIDELIAVCDSMTLSEIQMCMMTEDNALSRVAWVFYGQRRQHTAGVKMKLTKLAGEHQLLTISVDGVALVETLQLSTVPEPEDIPDDGA